MVKKDNKDLKDIKDQNKDHNIDNKKDQKKNQKKDDKQYSTAFLQSVKSSPLKVTRVTGSVVGMKASDAVKSLSFCKLKMASYVKSLILSALSNAENNHNLDIDELYVKKFDIGKSFTLKRMATRARGKSSRILKRFTNIRVYLSEKIN